MPILEFRYQRLVFTVTLSGFLGECFSLFLEFFPCFQVLAPGVVFCFIHQ
jgi:hypothetical protein